MIEVEEVLEIIRNHTRDFDTESVSLHDSLGRILAESWYCDRDFPAYDRVTMDGIAIDWQTFEDGTRAFEIEGVAAAGDIKKTLQSSQRCLEVMTGGVLPDGANCVIRYEDLLIENGVATVTINIVKERQNIHAKGQDQLKGDCLVRPGVRISSVEIGVAASIGKSQVQVKKKPSIIIISTGDELVEVEETPKDHQIRKSNVHNIYAYLKSIGLGSDMAHLNDSKAEISDKMKTYIKEYDVIIMSGGVSKGKFDYIPEVLDSLGVKKLFHRVAQRPGKPFWFGNNSDCTVFALPGNPISSFMCTRKYVDYWLQLSLTNLPPKKTFAILAEDVHFRPALTYFLEVRLESSESGQLLAFPMKGNGSGDHSNLLKADAFIELPAGKDLYEKGNVFEVFGYR